MKLFREGRRFALVGILNALVSFSVFYLCYVEWQLASSFLAWLDTINNQSIDIFEAVDGVSIDASVSSGIGYMAGILNSFILNSRWTFGVASYSHSQLLRFIALNIVGLTISSFSMFYFVDVRENPYLITWILVVGIVTILNFLGSKYWAFVQVE